MPNQMRRGRVLLLLPLVTAALLCRACFGKDVFSYSECLFGRAKTLRVAASRLDPLTSSVEFDGVDTAGPSQPFEWDFGDGTTDTGWFPQQHFYEDSRRNYVVKVTAHYPDGESDAVQVAVRLGQLSLAADRPSLPRHVRVVVPQEKPPLQAVRAPYAVSPTLAGFDDSFFEACTRETVEYVLTQAAAIQLDLANNDVCGGDGRFEQALLRDAGFAGMYSIWYTDPVCFGVGDYGFKGEIKWSSFFHEMGHNVTLNSPAKFHWGFRQDGPANAVYSETMAQIFQHATAHELVNHAEKYGISEELALDIAESATDSMAVVRRSYESYRKNGSVFCSWNDAETEPDDAFDTFMTIAFKFFEHAERDGTGYREPVKRLMTFLQQFNPEWEKSFSARKNSPQAEQFRATLAAAALSRAFENDLREEFRDLLFPIDDETFERLMAPVAAKPPSKTESD